jgi:hypothetical protein
MEYLDGQKGYCTIWEKYKWQYLAQRYPSRFSLPMAFSIQRAERSISEEWTFAANAKFPPFIPFEDKKWWDLLVKWGINVVRLTLAWEAIEPEPYFYN